jgi:DNA-binding MarR family transcriptional regulator
MSADNFGEATLRDGETVDETSHAQANAVMKAQLRRERFGDLAASEQALLETLAAMGGDVPASEAADAVADGNFVVKTCRNAASRLVEKDLIESRPVLSDPRKRRWVLTEKARAWLRAAGGASE